MFKKKTKKLNADTRIISNDQSQSTWTADVYNDITQNPVATVEVNSLKQLFKQVSPKK